MWVVGGFEFLFGLLDAKLCRIIRKSSKQIISRRKTRHFHEKVQIRVRDIMEAVEGPFDLAPGIEVREAAVANRPDFLWPQLTAQISSVLGEATMDWMCLEAARRDLPRHNSDAPMYFI